MADIGTGTPVANALLSIKGGDIGSYASLIVGSDPVATRTLRSNVPAETGVIDDIYLKLDASGVAAGAANLGTAWTYTLTYTLGP